jgi:hypothetical protein
MGQRWSYGTAGMSTPSPEARVAQVLADAAADTAGASFTTVAEALEAAGGAPATADPQFVQAVAARAVQLLQQGAADVGARLDVGRNLAASGAVAYVTRVLEQAPQATLARVDPGALVTLADALLEDSAVMSVGLEPRVVRFLHGLVQGLRITLGPAAQNAWGRLQALLQRHTGVLLDTLQELGRTKATATSASAAALDMLQGLVAGLVMQAVTGPGAAPNTLAGHMAEVMAALGPRPGPQAVTTLLTALWHACRNLDPWHEGFAAAADALRACLDAASAAAPPGMPAARNTDVMYLDVAAKRDVAAAKLPAPDPAAEVGPDVWALLDPSPTPMLALFLLGVVPEAVRARRLAALGLALHGAGVPPGSWQNAADAVTYALVPLLRSRLVLAPRQIQAVLKGLAAVARGAAAAAAATAPEDFIDAVGPAAFAVEAAAWANRLLGAAAGGHPLAPGVASALAEAGEGVVAALRAVPEDAVAAATAIALEDPDALADTVLPGLQAKLGRLRGQTQGRVQAAASPAARRARFLEDKRGAGAARATQQSAARFEALARRRAASKAGRARAARAVGATHDDLEALFSDLQL